MLEPSPPVLQNPDLPALIRQSSALSDDEKNVLIEKVAGMSPEEQQRVAQIFWDEEHQLAAIRQTYETEKSRINQTFLSQLEQFARTKKIHIRNKIEDEAKQEDEQEEDNLLRQL